MQKTDRKRLTQQPNPIIKGEGKVDLMIKSNPSKIFEVCSACNKDMELEDQQPSMGKEANTDKKYQKDLMELMLVRITTHFT